MYDRENWLDFPARLTLRSAKIIMGNQLIEKWKQKGNIWIWRYKDNPKNYSGFHLIADSSACHSLNKLFTLMENAKWPSSKIIKISRQDFIDPTGCIYQKKILDSIKIRYQMENDPDRWELEWDCKINAFTLTIGENKLIDLKKGINDIESGKGDYAIGPNNESNWNEMCLWFWWYIC